MAGFDFHSGCWGAIALTRSSANINWNGTGFSDHNVPSLSKVAIRSAGGTKSGPPSFVTLPTNSTIAFFEPESFHEGSGSAAGCAGVVAAGAGVDPVPQANVKAMTSSSPAILPGLIW